MQIKPVALIAWPRVILRPIAGRPSAKPQLRPMPAITGGETCSPASPGHALAGAGGAVRHLGLHGAIQPHGAAFCPRGCQPAGAGPEPRMGAGPCRHLRHQADQYHPPSAYPRRGHRAGCGRTLGAGLAGRHADRGETARERRVAHRGPPDASGAVPPPPSAPPGYFWQDEGAGAGQWWLAPPHERHGT